MLNPNDLFREVDHSKRSSGRRLLLPEENKRKIARANRLSGVRYSSSNNISSPQAENLGNEWNVSNSESQRDNRLMLAMLHFGE